ILDLAKALVDIPISSDVNLLFSTCEVKDICSKDRPKNLKEYKQSVQAISAVPPVFKKEYPSFDPEDHRCHCENNCCHSRTCARNGIGCFGGSLIPHFFQSKHNTADDN